MLKLGGQSRERAAFLCIAQACRARVASELEAAHRPAGPTGHASTAPQRKIAADESVSKANEGAR